MGLQLTKTVMDQLGHVFSDLYKFSRFTYGRNFIQGRHLQELSLELGKGLFEDGRRLIVNLPPRHSKTTFCSVNYPTWRVLQDPNLHILIITYGDDLSEEIGIQIRRLIKEWGGFFNVYLSSHTASKRKISFQDSDGRDYTGKIEVLGYKGAITGKTADIIIIDDLIKGPEDALSPSQNKKIVDFYLSAIYTRLFEHSELIIVSTRWSKTDLTGHLLEHSKEPWAVYIKKAIDDDNRALWPERFSLQRLQVIREEQGPFWWSALYLQEPEELKGDVFEGEFIQLPSSQFRDMEMERIVRYWDRAATEPKTGTDPDYTVGLLMALLKERINFNNKPLNQYLVLDVARFRGTPLENEQRILRTAECDGTGVEIYMEQEPGSLAKDSIYNYKRNILNGFKFRGIPSTGSKYIRAIDVAAKVEQGHVRFLGGDYLGDLFLEMRAFPYGAHDDQIDALSGAFNILKKTRRATVYV